MAVAACATQSQVVADREDLLAAAGFTIRPANTPDRIASLQRLPPERFVQQVRGGRITFVYADPLVCACLYIGDQGAYDRYKHEVFARNLANEQQMTAQLNEDSAWDFGPWGPGWYYTY
ncbi:MAG: hypothetical protein JO326_08725 [Acetobacteraceae bacterium]|nr:hypothetical protein [Acetobacteraceae bacterium]